MGMAAMLAAAPAYGQTNTERLADIWTATDGLADLILDGMESILVAISDLADTLDGVRTDVSGMQDTLAGIPDTLAGMASVQNDTYGAVSTIPDALDEITARLDAMQATDTDTVATAEANIRADIETANTELVDQITKLADQVARLELHLEIANDRLTAIESRDLTVVVQQTTPAAANTTKTDSTQTATQATDAPAPAPLVGGVKYGITKWTLTRGAALEHNDSNVAADQYFYLRPTAVLTCTGPVWLSLASVTVTEHCGNCNAVTSPPEQKVYDSLGNTLLSTQHSNQDGLPEVYHQSVDYQNRVLNAGESVTYTAQLERLNALRYGTGDYSPALNLLAVTVAYQTASPNTVCTLAGTATYTPVPTYADSRNIVYEAILGGAGTIKDYTNTMTCTGPVDITEIATAKITDDDQDFSMFESLLVVTGGKTTAGMMPTWIPAEPVRVADTAEITGKVVATGLLVDVTYRAPESVTCTAG